MTNPKKGNILFFQNSILPADGGVPRVTDIISKELGSRGYTSSFVFYDKDNSAYPANSKLQVTLQQPYHELEEQVLAFVAKGNFSFFICQNAYAGVFRKLYKKLRLLYPAVPFYCFLHASPDYWQLTYRARVAPGYKFFSSSIKRILKKIIYPFYNPYIRETSALYAICDKFVLLSDSFKPSFSRLYGTDKLNSKLVAIPNPLTFEPGVLTDRPQQKDKIVLMVSRLSEGQKRISAALKIWQQLQTPQFSDWQLSIVGSGPDETFYKDFTIQQGIKNVVFQGQHGNVLPFYKQAAVFIMTSVWEGLPMSLLEAQQNGVVPVAFDNFSALYDVVTDGENGFIIRDNNSSQFVHKLGMLMQDEELRKRMAAKAIETSQRYKVKKIADEWEKLFHEEL
ncbi:MAG: glycosyltransferase [Chitinophagaceae bacterium]